MGSCCNNSESHAAVQKGSVFADKSKKIIIIGAGPAGIHMASLLTKAGFKNITLLEKSNRICGKSKTFIDKYSIPHELGTCYTHPQYHAIFDLLEEYDMSDELVGFSDRSIITTELKKIGYKFVDEDGDGKFDEEQIIQPMSAWMLAKVEKNTLPEELHWIPDLLSGGIAMIDAVLRYKNLHSEIFGDFDDNPYGFPRKPKNMQDINMTMGEWLKKHKLHALLPGMIYAASIQGYGLIDEIPALYGLWWNRPEMYEDLFSFQHLIKRKPMVSMIKAGFESLWATIAESHRLNIIKNVTVTSVDRQLNDRNSPISIRYIIKRNDENDSKTDNSSDAEIICDALFIACDCSKALQFLTDAVQEETDIFSSLESYTFMTTVYERELREHATAIQIFPDILHANEGGVYAKRNSARIVRPGIQENILKPKNIEHMVCYQFVNKEIADDPNEEKILKEKMLQSLAETDNVTEDKIITNQIWDYFPKFPQKAINAGWPWYVKNEMQGKYKTFYIGSSVCFESVLDVVEYNLAFKEKFGF